MIEKLSAISHQRLESDGKAIRDLMLKTLEYLLRRPFTEKPVQWLTDNGSCYKAKETVTFDKRLGLDI